MFPVRTGTLQQVLDELVELSDERLATIVEELSTTEQDAVGFRYASLRTQSTQDRHLGQYLQFVQRLPLQRPPSYNERGEMADADISDTAKNEVTYAMPATTFMETMMKNPFVKSKQWAHEDTRCSLCVDDETVEQVDKDKRWSSEAKLMQHMLGQKHAPRVMWKRRMTILRNKDPDRKFSCPYCPDDERKAYVHLKDLERHILNSNINSDGRSHEIAKAEDGWFDPDWAGNACPEWEQQKAVQAKETFAEVGISFLIHEPELLGPTAHETIRGVEHGHFKDDTIRPICKTLYPNSPCQQQESQTISDIL